MATYDNWTILSEISLRRRKFDPANKTDLYELAYFKQNKKWRTSCPFYLEWPFEDVITMCHTKYTDHMLNKLEIKNFI
jgi:hypothetical protein